MYLDYTCCFFKFISLTCRRIPTWPVPHGQLLQTHMPVTIMEPRVLVLLPGTIHKSLLQPPQLLRLPRPLPMPSLRWAVQSGSLDHDWCLILPVMFVQMQQPGQSCPFYSLQPVTFQLLPARILNSVVGLLDHLVCCPTSLFFVPCSDPAVLYESKQELFTLVVFCLLLRPQSLEDVHTPEGKLIRSVIYMMIISWLLETAKIWSNSP